MKGDLQRNVNVKASVNGKELSPESVASVLDVLFRGGLIDNVLQTALGAQSAAMERAKLDLGKHIQNITETVRQATSTAEATAGEQPNVPEQGEKS